MLGLLNTLESEEFEKAGARICNRPEKTLELLTELINYYNKQACHAPVDDKETGKDDKGGKTEDCTDYRSDHRQAGNQC